jgi:uncharacterized protein YlxW (UPF0749 family)
MEAVYQNTMDDTNADTQDDRSLGDALSSLSASAGGLSSNVTELQEAVSDLQQSTEQLSESQGVSSTTLAQASASLSAQPHTGPDATQSSAAGYSAAGD